MINQADYTHPNCGGLNPSEVAALLWINGHPLWPWEALVDWLHRMELDSGAAVSLCRRLLVGNFSGKNPVLTTNGHAVVEALEAGGW